MRTWRAVSLRWASLEGPARTALGSGSVVAGDRIDAHYVAGAEARRTGLSELPRAQLVPVSSPPRRYGAITCVRDSHCDQRVSDQNSAATCTVTRVVDDLPNRALETRD